MRAIQPSTRGLVAGRRTASLLVLVFLWSCSTARQQAGGSALTLTRVSPAIGTTAGGTVVTLTGTGFLSGATVAFGTTAAASITVDSATQIRVTTAAAAAGTVAVTVTNPDTRSATLAAAFQYAMLLPLPDCATEPLPSSGTIYYVCDCQAGAEAGCQAGNDGNAGTSMATPWRTWAKARGQFQTMAAGSTVAFCKGGSWTGAGESAEWANAVQNKNCTATSPCTMRDYQAAWGGTARPRLKLTTGGAIMTIGWYQDYTASNLVRGLRFWNLEFAGSSADGRNAAEFGFYFEGGISDADFCNLEIHHGIKQAFRFITTSSLARFTIRGNDIHDNLEGPGETNIGMVVGGCNDLLVEGNRFDRVGGSSNRCHAIYINGDPGETQCFNGQTPVVTGYGSLCAIQRVTIRGNTITNTALDTTPKCVGTVVTMHDAVDGILVEDNVIAEPTYTPDPGCYGIAFGAGGETIRLTGLVIRNNLVFGVGGNGIAASGAPGAVIENNVVAGGPALTTCVAYPEENTSTGNGDLTSTGGRVRNNTCYFPSGGGGSAAIWGVNEGSGHVYANNAVVTSGGSACVGTPGSAGINGGVPVGSTVATNLCSATGSGWWINAGLVPSTANFHPTPTTSPLLGAGTALYAPATDILGVARGSPPTVGAYEQ
jgi:hypothetical protein